MSKECKGCRQPVVSKESGIKCAVCETLYHIASCSRLDPDLIPIVLKTNGPFCWKCVDCLNEKVPGNIESTIKKTISSLVTSLEQKLEGQIRIVDGEVRRCKKAVASVESVCTKQHQANERNAAV